MALTRFFDRRSQRSVPIALVVLVVLLVAARVVSSTYDPAPGPGMSGLVRWVSPEQAMELVRTSQKPVLFDFTAEWCEPCHKLDAEVYADRAIADDINRRFIPVRVVDRMREEGRNTPLVAELERAYSVRAFPTVVIAGPTGEIGRMEGFGGRERFQQMLAQVR